MSQDSFFPKEFMDSLHQGYDKKEETDFKKDSIADDTDHIEDLEKDKEFDKKEIDEDGE